MDWTFVTYTASGQWWTLVDVWLDNSAAVWPPVGELGIILESHGEDGFDPSISPTATIDGVIYMYRKQWATSGSDGWWFAVYKRLTPVQSVKSLNITNIARHAANSQRAWPNNAYIYNVGAGFEPLSGQADQHVSKFVAFKYP